MIEAFVVPVTPFAQNCSILRCAKTGKDVGDSLLCLVIFEAGDEPFRHHERIDGVVGIVWRDNSTVDI